MKEKKEYYTLPLEDCIERIAEVQDINKILKLYIKDSVDDEESWSSDLMMLLCEYYSIICRYSEIMNDLILTPPSEGEGEVGDIIYVDAHKYTMLSSYSKLMLVNEMELKFKYRVNLFIH